MATQRRARRRYGVATCEDSTSRLVSTLAKPNWQVSGPVRQNSGAWAGRKRGRELIRGRNLLKHKANEAAYHGTPDA